MPLQTRESRKMPARPATREMLDRAFLSVTNKTMFIPATRGLCAVTQALGSRPSANAPPAIAAPLLSNSLLLSIYVLPNS
jgi:hypothetical protein